MHILHFLKSHTSVLPGSKLKRFQAVHGGLSCGRGGKKKSTFGGKISVLCQCSTEMINLDLMLIYKPKFKILIEEFLCVL